MFNLVVDGHHTGTRRAAKHRETCVIIGNMMVEISGFDAVKKVFLVRNCAAK